MESADHLSKLLLRPVFRTQGIVEPLPEPPVIWTFLHISHRIARRTDRPGSQGFLHGAEAFTAVCQRERGVDRHKFDGRDPQILEIGDPGDKSRKSSPKALLLSGHHCSVPAHMEAVDHLFCPVCGRKRILRSLLRLL